MITGGQVDRFGEISLAVPADLVGRRAPLGRALDMLALLCGVQVVAIAAYALLLHVV